MCRVRVWVMLGKIFGFICRASVLCNKYKSTTAMDTVTTFLHVLDRFSIWSLNETQLHHTL